MDELRIKIKHSTKKDSSGSWQRAIPLLEKYQYTSNIESYEQCCSRPFDWFRLEMIYEYTIQ